MKKQHDQSFFNNLSLHPTTIAALSPFLDLRPPSANIYHSVSHQSSVLMWTIPIVPSSLPTLSNTEPTTSFSSTPSKRS